MATTFKRGHKFDLLDMLMISPSEVQELFWKELNSKIHKKKPNLDNLKVMLDSGVVDLDAKNEFDSTPLHLASWRDSRAVAELLIQSRAEVDAEDEYGFTPLHWAASNDSRAVAELLIQSGADVNAKTNSGWTPLHWAAYNNFRAVAELLIQSGAEVDAKDDEGKTPYDLSNKRTKVSKLLKPKK